jgi:hypothetical protein
MGVMVRLATGGVLARECSELPVRRRQLVKAFRGRRSSGI